MPRKPNLSRKSACILLTIAAIVFSCALRGWVTTPDFTGGLWPADINSQVVGMLGGSVNTNAVGRAVSNVNFVSIFFRLAAGFGVLAGLLIAIKKDKTSDAITQSAIVLLVSSAWWGLWLFGDLGFTAAQAFAVGALPLWVTATVGSLFWIWWNALWGFANSNAPALESPHPSKKPLVALSCAMAVWVAVSFWMNACLYQQLFIPHGDSAMYEEHLWNVWHGKGFRSYLDQGLFLGEHVQVIHLLLLPVHMLWPSHLLLELAESLALASCAVPIYRLTVRKTGDQWAAAFMGMAWLLYFPMHFLDIAIDQKTFRPIALGLPFLFWMIEFVEVRKYKSAFGCLVVALSAKEDIALVTFPLLAVLAFQAWNTNKAGNTQPSKPASTVWPGLMAIGSVVYLLVVVLAVIPWFRSGEVVHYSRYFGDLGSSPSELVKTAIRSPGKVIAQACTIQTLLYVCVFLGPLAFVPLKRLTCLAAGVISFGMLSLLQFGDDSGLPPVPYHHFHAPLLVVIFWGAISGLQSRFSTTNDSEGDSTDSRTGQNAARNPRRMAGLICCLCAATGITGSLMPVGVTFWSAQSGFGYQRLYSPTDPRQQERAAMADHVVAQIPADARVASTDFIHTRLTHCERSYDYSKYLRKVNDYQPGVPADTNYIVIDTRHKYSEYQSANDVPELQQPGEWELLPDTTNGAFLVLKRKD